MILELLPSAVVILSDGSLLQGAVHSLDLAVGPRMIGLGETVLDTVFLAGLVKHVHPIAGGRPRPILDGIAELDAVVGEHRVDAIGNSFDQGPKEARGSLDVGCLVLLSKDELASSVDGYEEVEFSLFGPDLGDIDVEVADGIVLEGSLWLVAFDLRQPADAVPLQTPMQRGAGQMRDRRL